MVTGLGEGKLIQIICMKVAGDYLPSTIQEKLHTSLYGASLILIRWMLSHWFDQSSNVVAINQWWLILELEKLS